MHTKEKRFYILERYFCRKCVLSVCITILSHFRSVTGTVLCLFLDCFWSVFLFVYGTVKGRLMDGKKKCKKDSTFLNKKSIKFFIKNHKKISKKNEKFSKNSENFLKNKISFQSL